MVLRTIDFSSCTTLQKFKVPHSMFKKADKTELLLETIITCPKCHKRNRLSKRVGKSVYRCGMCQLQLPNPFLPSSESQAQASSRGSFSSWKTVGVSILAVCGLLVLVSSHSGGGQSSSPSSYAAPVASQSETIPQQPIVVPQQPFVVLKNRSLPSSNVLTSPAKRGRGSLKVSNGTSSDAYIKLVDSHSRKLVAAFYVTSNSTFMLKKIPDGVYQVLFVSGDDWDSKIRSFTRNASFTRFDHSLNFATTRQTGRIRYRVFELTLNPVVGGNATTSATNEQEFSRY
jgi:ribosomal protein L37AE/L43A